MKIKHQSEADRQWLGSTTAGGWGRRQRRLGTMRFYCRVVVFDDGGGGPAVVVPAAEKKMIQRCKDY
ncbi:hypothetical protein HanRHA438_Chr12g0552271 [Helianthus annuus]|nr:hypothetical protein HanIR_Chr12g0583241 [Helianthus annuus]KAJ0866482.1 hypothetical protein HanRHA438_Chr12g0552271 [Helianthus annuus]